MFTLMACANDNINEPDPEINPLVSEIVGTWAWDVDNTFRYVFYADGTGRRGFATQEDEFSWEIVEDRISFSSRNNFVLTGLNEERWVVEILDDALRLGMVNPFMYFYYSRIDETLIEREPLERGWQDRIFICEIMGFRFVLPETWEPATDLHIAFSFGMGEEVMAYLGLDVASEMPADFNMIMAGNPITSASISFIYEQNQMPIPVDGQADAIEGAISGIMYPLQNMDANVMRNSGTTRIGDFNWHSISAQMNLFDDLQMIQHYFVYVDRYFIRIITISYFTREESLAQMLSMFVNLDEPMPVAEPIHRAEQLRSTSWYWENDVYHFNENGTGRRGTGGILEPFEWRTIGSDTLIIIAPLMVEAWTYTIYGNALMLDSLQEPDISVFLVRNLN